jgi:hypothetical protein
MTNFVSRWEAELSALVRRWANDAVDASAALP